MLEARKQAQHYHGLRKNEELRYLLIWLCELRVKPVLAIFVFDGPNAPPRISGPLAVPFHTNLIRDFQRLIRAQGFCVQEVCFLIRFCFAGGLRCFVLQSSGDASLELWRIEHQVDAIMTEDVRVLIFGTACILHTYVSLLYVYKLMLIISSARFFKDVDTVALYSKEYLAHREERPLTPHGLFLLMILLGNDYATVSGLSFSNFIHFYIRIQGVAVLTAQTVYALTNTALKTLLIFAAEDYSPPRLQEYLHDWRKALEHEICSNVHEFLPSPLPDTAAHLQELHDFPSLYAVMNLAPPVGEQLPALREWRIEALDLGNLGDICQDVFSWTPAGYIPKTLRHIWCARIFSLLIQVRFLRCHVITLSDSCAFRLPMIPSFLTFLRHALQMFDVTSHGFLQPTAWRFRSLICFAVLMFRIGIFGFGYLHLSWIQQYLWLSRLTEQTSS